MTLLHEPLDTPTKVSEAVAQHMPESEWIAGRSHD